MMKSVKCLLALLLVIAMLISNLPAVVFAESTQEFAGGSGTAEDPYLISTKEHLDNVRNYLSAYFKMVNDIDFVDADFERGGEFYNGGRQWLPIAEFRGTFDGNGKTISNLKGPGIFGDMYNATISNLHIRNRSIPPTLFVSNIYEWNNGYCAGGIACAISGTIVRNCTGNGITIAASNKDGPIGGLVGVSYSSTIENCEFEANCDYVASKDNHIGLICAFAEGTTIKGCYSFGAFTNDAYGSLGGIVGLARSCLINNCENRAALCNKDGYDDGCGGIVGYFTYGGSLADTGIINCKNWGSIKSEAPRDNVGGIAGVLFDGLDLLTLCSNEGNIKGYTAGGIVGLCNSDSTAKIDKCTNSGTVNGSRAGGITGYLVDGTIESMHNAGEVLATYVCGGIAGESYGSVLKCSNIGKVNLSSGSSSTTYLGGIVGANGDVVSECYNAGKITANCYNARVGGIAGVNLSGDIIINTYNIGDIICDYSDNKKIYTIGGICGENKQPTDAIVNCYNIGNVPEMDDDIGLICGLNPEPGEAFKNCYIVEGSLIADVGFGYGDGSATQLSEQQMQAVESFSGFDFDSIWTMAGNEDYLYPELKSVEMIYVPYIPGDMNDDEEINDADAMYLLRYTLFPSRYPLNQDGDLNGDWQVNDADAMYLLRHTLFPERYPLK